jgi:acyl carrier protein
LYGKTVTTNGLHLAGSLNDNHLCSIIDTALGLPPGHAKRHPDSSLLELGADSFGLAKIATALKQHTGKHLEMVTLFSYPSVKTVIKMAAQQSCPDGTETINHLQRPAPFSLLGVSEAKIESICLEASVQRGDVEDAYPLSSSQKMHMDVLLGAHHNNTCLLWQMTRYRLAENIDKQRLLRALKQWQRHEESLRWVIATDKKLGWVTLQLRPDVDDRVEEIECGSEAEAKAAVEARYAACRHVAGARTLSLTLVAIRGEPQLELTFIESHCFTEGQGRLLMLETLRQAYNGDPMDDYPSYSNFISQHRPGDDPVDKLRFWTLERDALEQSEGHRWLLKQSVLLNRQDLAEDVLAMPDSVGFALGPFQRIASEANMTLPIFTEAIFSLSLALYFSQQDLSFVSRGSSIVYDRSASMRTADHRFSAVRAVTGAFHPHWMPLDLARINLWYAM